MDFLLWGFLNGALELEAWNLLDSIPIEQEFETWRRLAKDIVQKGPGERMFLEREIMRPNTCKIHSDILAALLNFQLSKAKWHSAGGRRSGNEEEASIVMQMLPRTMREKVLYDYEEAFLENPAKLKTWAKNTPKKWSVWKLSESGARILEDRKEEDDEFRSEIINTLEPDMDEEETLAAIANIRRSWGGGPAGGGRPRREQPLERRGVQIVPRRATQQGIALSPR